MSMNGQIALPDAFKQGMSSKFKAHLDPSQESLADGIGQGYAIIGYKGKTWSLRHKGERHVFVRPDDGTPASYIDLIVLRNTAVKSRSYFAAFNPDASDGVRPICASINGTHPDADVQDKQANACAICPRNEWRTNAEGRKTRECAEFKRLAVLLIPSQTKAMLGEPLVEPVFLRIPAGSLNDLANFGDMMQRQGHHYTSFVTRVSFDPQEAHPKMVFRAIQPLTDKEADLILKMREEPLAKRITGEETTLNSAPATQKVTAVQEQPKDPAPGALGLTDDPEEDEDTPPANGKGLDMQATERRANLTVIDATATEIVTETKPEPEPGPLEVTAAVSGKATEQTVDDIGESDDVLDADIRGLLGK